MQPAVDRQRRRHVHVSGGEDADQLQPTATVSRRVVGQPVPRHGDQALRNKAQGMLAAGVISLAGTGTPETFYSGPVFNALGQVTNVRYGNAGASQQIETYNYFINSARLQRMQTTLQGSGSQQDLQYTYDRVTNVKSISDKVWSGSGSSSITNVAYDDLHRLTSLTREGVTCVFGYNAIGNVLTNGEHNRLSVSCDLSPRGDQCRKQIVRL